MSRCQPRRYRITHDYRGSGTSFLGTRAAARYKPEGIIERLRGHECLLCLSILELSSPARMVRTCLNYYCLKYVRACIYIDTKALVRDGVRVLEFVSVLSNGDVYLAVACDEDPL